MITLLGIGMLEEIGAIEVGEAMLIVGKMRRHPVEDDTDALLVEMIDEKHQILRCAIACRRRKVTYGLIAPRAVKGMLHNRQQLDMGEAHLLGILGQLKGEFPIGEIPVSQWGPRRRNGYLVRRRRSGGANPISGKAGHGSLP